MAEFEMECPHCGEKLTVQDEWAGMEATCPFCQGDIIVRRRNPARSPHTQRPRAKFSKAPHRSVTENLTGVRVSGIIIGFMAVLFLFFTGRIQYFLGNRYIRAKNSEKAVVWYRQAAEKGHAGAQACLGLCYEDGYGVVPDDTEAFKWRLKAAKQGDARS